ncbi:MAG: response regulator, partial [Bacteroidales bacterium]|nr:response regulator [Bacteroidales bacterium]
IEEMTSQTTDLYEHPLAVSNALNDLKVDVLFMQHGMSDLCLAESEKESTTESQLIDVKRADAFKQFDILYNGYQGAKSDIDNIYNDFVGLNATLDRVSSLLLEGNKAVGLAYMKSSGIEGNQVGLLLKKIQVVDDYSEQEGQSIYNNAVVLNRNMNIRLLSWFVGIAIFVLLLITILSKNFHRPLRELLAATKLFKEGKKDARCGYVSQNEFGLLAVAFNELADKIENDYKLNEKSARIARMMLAEEDAHHFGQTLLTVLLEETWAQMGALYLLNEEKTNFEYFECIGMNVAGCKPFSAKKFEGEFGKAIVTRKIQHLTNIPKDTQFKFSTVVGEFLPREIITIPVSKGDEVVAIISLASVKSFSKGSLRLIYSIFDTLNARMDGILAFRKIIAFSQKMEYQNLELETQKKELSAQASALQEQNMELEMQKKQLNESNKLKTSFLSNMSHELRTPLNSVIALSGVLSRRLVGKIPDEEYSYIDVIERNGKALLFLINDILDLSRIESGKEELNITKFDVNSVFREIVDMIEPQAIQKGISLRYTANPNLPNINSDYEKSLHILQNLVSNAVKFTEEGYVEITAEAKEENIYIYVTDTGIGIKKENLSKIFEEFRQVDGSNSRKYGGTGLGLSISQKYAELLGGRIYVESTYGKGSRFTLELPANFDTHHTTKKSEEFDVLPKEIRPEKYAGTVHAEEKTILLVEDTDAAVIQMRDILETEGYQMMVARDGSDALKQISKRIPDGLILDLMMPGVDGFEVLKCIRDDKVYDHLPIIILTAKYVTKEEFSFLKSNNIYQLIHKGDINKEKLLDTVACMVSAKSEPKMVEPEHRNPIPVSGTPIVLVVEDNPDNMMTIKALLSDRCEVVESENGMTGIEMAKKYHPNLILMDIALPGVNGIDALDELRKDDQLKDIPVIAISANAMKGDREDFLAHGFDGYISKPIDNQHFMEVINKWI